MKFNTEGPCLPGEHYMLPAAPRLPEDARSLIEHWQFFVVTGPRQSGKTTTLAALARDLRADGCASVLFSCEDAGVPDDIGATEDRIGEAIRVAAQDALPAGEQPPARWPDARPGLRLGDWLSDWSEACPRPLVLFFDDIDTLPGLSLLSVLGELRVGHSYRADTPFLSSAVLCGLRDVSSDRLTESLEPQPGLGVPFNISADTLRLAEFTRDQVGELYAQHTAETGQEFTPEAVTAAFECTGGQPWLVNAIAAQISREMAEPVTAAHVGQARRRLIESRPPHLESLAARLDEPRVRRYIERRLADPFPRRGNPYDDDYLYVRELGLIAATDPVRITSPIYREVIVRTLAARAGQPNHDREED